MESTIKKIVLLVLFLILFQYINGDLITKNDIRGAFIASLLISILLLPLILFIFKKDKVSYKIDKKIFIFLSLFLITYFSVYQLREDYFKKYVAISAFKHYISDENQSLNIKDYDFLTVKPSGNCEILYRYKSDQNDSSKDFFYSYYEKKLIKTKENKNEDVYNYSSKDYLKDIFKLK